MSFIKIINEYRKKAFSERDKGDRLSTRLVLQPSISY